MAFFPPFPFQPYEWRGFRQTHGLRSKARRVLSQFSPHDWTAFHWEGTASFLHYLTVVLLLAVFLCAELSPFYLKVSQERKRRVRGWLMSFRICCGWNLTIPSSLRGWRVCFCVHCLR
jgi:hypothetical protein